MTETRKKISFPSQTAEVPEISAPRPERPTDVSRLLSTGRPEAWGVWGLFAAANATFALSTLDHVKSPWPSIVALLVVNLAAVLLVLPAADPFPLDWTIGVVAAAMASTALIDWQLLDHEGASRETWHYLANTWMLFFLTLRGRVGFAWFGFLSMMGIHLLWAVTTDHSIVGALVNFDSDIGLLVVASLFTAALHRTSRQINALNRRSVELAAAAATNEVEKEIREARLDELADMATPLLKRVAEASHTSHSDRVDYLLAEASLRDSVRARSLHLPEIVQATVEARKRGIDVTLLDDRGGGLPTELAMKLLAARIAEALRNLDSGSLTIRLSPPGRRIAASIVVEHSGKTRRIDLDERGEVLENVL